MTTPTLTPEHLRAVNIGLAEWMGWKHCPAPAGGVATSEWQRPDRSWAQGLPRYTSSLNALRPVLERLNDIDWAYLNTLLLNGERNPFSAVRIALTTPPEVLADCLAKVLGVGPYKP